jgi:DNA-binding CsgD family transcriptional regulator
MCPGIAKRASDDYAIKAGAKPFPQNAPALRPSPGLIVDSISDVVEVIDARGVITYSNLSSAHQAALGLDPVLGRRCHTAYDKVCPSCAKCPLDEVFNTGRRITQECRVVTGQGGHGWVRQRLYPMLDENGRVAGVLRMVFDITKEKRERVKEAEYLDSLEQSLHNRGRERPADPPQALSAREREVLAYMADGLSNREIARLLNISPNTVKSHVVHIFNKLGVKDRTHAAVTATRLNLI